MFITILDGRDSGKVVDMLEEEARNMLATGQARAVEFGEPPAEVRQPDPELSRETPEMSSKVTESGPIAPVLLETARTLSPQRQTAHAKPPGGFRNRRG
jgi:hypothetical protein